MEEQKVFRKKTMEQISSPEQLSDYLRVTSPGIWVILSAVVLLLAGMIAWASVGTLNTTVEAKAIVKNGKAQIVSSGTDFGGLKPGAPVQIVSEDYIVSSVDTDEYGRSVVYTEVSLPDGTYDAEVVTEQVRPIQFLLESR